METDACGVPVTTSEPDAVRLLDLAAHDLPWQHGQATARIAAALQRDGDLVAAHCLAGFVKLFGARRALQEEAGACLARALQALARRGGTRREAALVRGLGLWQAQGEMGRAADVLDAALADRPRDLLLIRLVHALRLRLGDAAGLRRSVERALPAWHPGLRGHGHVLACHAFALAETGEAEAAERVGLLALAAEPEDPWAAHAVVQAFGASGRHSEGLEWITRLEPRLGGRGRFLRHLQWHRALFHLALGEGEEALGVYERRIHDEPPEGMHELVDAASLLWRIEVAGLPAGAHHWDELADIAERRIGEHCWVLADLHAVLCCAAAGRGDAVEAMLGAMRHRAWTGTGTQARLLRELGCGVAEGVAASLGGDPRRAAGLLAAAAPLLSRLGGSLAQRELFARIEAKASADAARSASRRPALRDGRPMMPLADRGDAQRAW